MCCDMCDFAFCFFVSLQYIRGCCLVALQKIENLCEIGDWWIHESLFSGTGDTACKTFLMSRPFTHQVWEVEGLQNFTGDNTHNFTRNVFSSHRKRSKVNEVKFCSFSRLCNPFLTFLVKSGFLSATFPAFC